MNNELKTIEDIEKLPHKLEYFGKTSKETAGGKPFECDEWRLTLYSENGYHTFKFYTGLGRRKDGKPTKPKIADILYSLLLDGEAVYLTHQKWCYNYGYSDDSIKALEMYKECVKTGEQLAQLYSTNTICKLKELLIDYCG